MLTMVDTLLVGGGAESIALQIATRLDRSRFDPVFCVTRDRSHEAYEDGIRLLKDAEVPFLGLERGSRFDMHPWMRLRKHMRTEGTVILHTHMFGSNAWGALMSTVVKVPIFVAHEHSWSYQDEPVRKFVDRNLIARRADAFVAVSTEDQRRMIEIERIPWGKTRLIQNGVAGFDDSGDGSVIRDELGIDPEQPVLGIVASLRPEKAVEVIVRAAAEIAESLPEVRVVISGGDGPRESSQIALAELAQSLGVEEKVHFLGHRVDVADVIASFDVAVLCSDREGSPLSIMEYMDAGKPVVATRVGGVPDIVVEGETGLLVPPRDPTALARAAVELLRDRDRAARMGAAGRKRMRSMFTIEETVGRVESLYEELLAGKGLTTGRDTLRTSL